jgi:hypothetical protein
MQLKTDVIEGQGLVVDCFIIRVKLSVVKMLKNVVRRPPNDEINTMKDIVTPIIL